MAIWRDRRRADLGGLALMSRHFPPPWSVDDPDKQLGQDCYIVREAGTFRHLFAARRNHVRSWGMSGPLAVVAEPTLMTLTGSHDIPG